MRPQILAPASLLCDPGLPVAAKVVWLGCRHLSQAQALSLAHPAPPARELLPAQPPSAGRPSVSDLQAICGLSPATIRTALAHLTAAGWFPVPRTPEQPAAVIPADLLAARHVGAQAKVLYGLLQLTPGFGNRRTTVPYAGLCKLLPASRNTFKHAVNDLVQADWLRILRATQNRPPQYILLNPVLYAQQVKLVRAKRRLKRAQFKGEALMREFLSLLVDSDQFHDNAAPGFLINPVTEEPLQFDRFYPPAVAWEYNGAQHYGTTDWFPRADEVKEQQLRDLIKAGICFYRGVTLVVVHAEDLSLHGMRAKVGNLLPLRDLAGYDLVVDYLEKVAVHYRSAARQGRPPSPVRKAD